MFNLIKSYLPIIKDTILTNAQSFGYCVKKSTKKVENFINKQNVIGILLLGIIVYFFSRLLVFTIEMYKQNNAVDGNWTIIVTAVVGLITIYATAFSNNLAKQNITESNNKANIEINQNNNETELSKQIVDKNNNGVDDALECDMSNADENPDNLDLI